MNGRGDRSCRWRALGHSRASILAAAAVTLLGIGGFASPAQASHFRFAHNTWARVAGTTVEFTSTQAWRASAVESLPINFGDGISGDGPPITIGTFTDLAGEEYTIIQYTVQHTYASEGPFLAFSESCCRIYSLLNASGASERIETIVDLRGGNTGSPVSSIPVIVQMAQGGLNTVALPIADPDGDPLTCRMATSTESLIPSVASAGGNDLSVSSGCSLSWDTSATTIGDKFAAQVAIEAIHADNSSRVALDFIVEITGNLGATPVCAGTSGNHIVNVGQMFTGNFTGTDTDGGNLTVSHLGLPPGATLTPPSGTTQAQPFDAVFDWTPQTADAGTARAVTIVYTDPQGLQGTCAFSINVPASVCGNGATEPPFEECDDSNTMPGDGCDENCQIEQIVCGDGTTTPPETCDDGNTESGDGCSSTCELEARCGDGEVNQQSEECDDANTVSGDGCSATCQVEDPCVVACAAPGALHVNAANKVLVGTNGNDVLCGDARNNMLRGNGGADMMCGFGGNDTLASHLGGDDYLDGGDGDDILRGESGNDILIGGPGNDSLYGHNGADHLDGGPGNDILNGGGGNDSLDGGADTDVLNGEGGTDTCINGETLHNCP